MIANIHRGTRKAYWRLLAAGLVIGMLGAAPAVRAQAGATLPEHLQGTYKIESATVTLDDHPVLREPVTANLTLTLTSRGLEGVDIASVLKSVLGSQTVVTLEPEKIKDSPGGIHRVVTGSFNFTAPYATHPLMRLTMDVIGDEIHLWINGAVLLTNRNIPPPHQEYMRIRILFKEE